MAQFDVYKNPSRTSSKQFPFLVDIQGDFLNSLTTRIVIPLGITDVLDQNTMGKLTPVISYKDEEHLLMTSQIFSIPARLLVNPVGSLTHCRQIVLNSLDFAITGF